MLQEGASVPKTLRKAVRASFNDGYAAGGNDAFQGYDGGWTMGQPYVIVLEPGSGQIVYRIRSRTPLEAGVDYYLCGHAFTTRGTARRAGCLAASPCTGRSAEVGEDGGRGVLAVGRDHAAGRMGRGATQVDAGHGRARGEPVLPHLVGTHLALEDVPAGEADACLDVRSAEHLVVLEAVLEVRREPRDQVDELARYLVAVARPSRR